MFHSISEYPYRKSDVTTRTRLKLIFRIQLECRSVYSEKAPSKIPDKVAKLYEKKIFGWSFYTILPLKEDTLEELTKTLQKLPLEVQFSADPQCTEIPHEQ